MLILDLWGVIGPFLSLALSKANDIDRRPAVGSLQSG